MPQNNHSDANGLRVVGFDPSLRNWGVSKGILSVSLDKPSLYIQDVSVICPVLPTGKQVRQNSLDLESAKQLCHFALQAAKDAQAIFVEVPVGSQSARAMASYGICVGVLGALRATGIPFFEVTPTEVKVAAVGYKNATKQEMIQWAVSKHPEANWPMFRGQVSEAKAEHMADATAAIYAGLACNSFQQMLPFLRKNHANQFEAT
jgi:Holliday junction resolvasome RuvABC endonuclease subunit